MKIGLAIGVFLAASFACSASAQGTAAVDFAISKEDPSVFYPTGLLRKGDRFEINAQKLGDYDTLVAVRCDRDCSPASFARAYALHTGIQHMRIWGSGQYFFWLQRGPRSGVTVTYHGVADRVTVHYDNRTQGPQQLPIVDSQSRSGNFVAEYGSGTVLALRSLYTHSVPEN